MACWKEMDERDKKMCVERLRKSCHADSESGESEEDAEEQEKNFKKCTEKPELKSDRINDKRTIKNEPIDDQILMRPNPLLRSISIP